MCCRLDSFYCCYVKCSYLQNTKWCFYLSWRVYNGFINIYRTWPLKARHTCYGFMVCYFTFGSFQRKTRKTQPSLKCFHCTVSLLCPSFLILVQNYLVRHTNNMVNPKALARQPDDRLAGLVGSHWSSDIITVSWTGSPSMLVVYAVSGFFTN